MRFLRAALALGLFLAGVALTAYSFMSLVAPGTELIPNRPSFVDFLTFGLTFIAFPSVGLVVVLVIVMLIYREGFQDLRFGYASAISFVLLIFVFLLSMIQFGYLRRKQVTY